MRATAETSGNDAGGTVLSATGYIVAHHTINVNSKVTGRLEWIGVEKGDNVKRAKFSFASRTQEFRASYKQAEGRLANARAYLDELQHGSRPEEIQQAQHNLDEARATLVNDKLTLDRTKNWPPAEWFRGRPSTTLPPSSKLTSSASTLSKRVLNYRRSDLVPRRLARAQGAVTQAQGQLDYAKSQLDATIIRAPVTGTILDRTAEKGELITAQFASAAAGGPQG